MIEKKIHFCWYGEGDYSPLILKCMETWKDKLSDWEFILWNEKNSPMSHPFVKKAMKDKRYAFVADYVRCYALYHHGGVYLDTDMEILKDLEPLRLNKAFLAPEDVRGLTLSCGVMGAEKNHELYRNMLEFYDFNYDYIPIPQVISKLIGENDIDLTILQMEAFYPYNPFDINQPVKQLMISDIKEVTFAVHHWNYSWKLSFIQRAFRKLKSYFC